MPHGAEWIWLAVGLSNFWRLPGHASVAMCG